MTLTPRELLEQDRALEARELALTLPDGDIEKAEILSHTNHLAGSNEYQSYYRTMRGGVCPEPEVFTRHHFVKRFASIRRLILERKHKTILDLGCLDGWQLLNLAAHGVKGVGVDLCEEALAVARERANKWGFHLRFIQAPIEEEQAELYQVDANGLNPILFDAVILSEVLEHVLDPLACLKTAARHLAKGGIVYVSVPASPIPHHGKLEDAREHARVFNADQLKALAGEAGLAVQQDYEVIEEQDQGQAYSHRTISFRRAQITVYCNHVTGGWNPEDIDNLGASEEMVVKVAESWVRQGHEVTVHQNGYDGLCKGVSYLSRAVAPEPDRDILVLYKTLEHSDRLAKARIFWTTDLPQNGQVASFLPPRIADELDAVMCISEYHRMELLKAVPWLNPQKVRAHWLGVDYLELSGSVRDSVGKRIIYASSPDRGLGFLLEEWSKIREKVPEAELRVVYGFDFWKQSENVLPTAQAAAMQAERARLMTLMEQPGISYLGRLSREEYLREMNEASIWAYPCTGGELCCKTALEAQFLGVYPVVIPTMALQETVLSGSKVPKEHFVSEVIRALQEEACGQAWRIPSWDDLANTFNDFIQRDQSGQQWIQSDSYSPSLPTDSGVMEKLPEIFGRPHKTGALAVKTSLDVVMAVAGMAFDGNTDRERNLGGSETAGLQLARSLVKRGHRVSVFSNLPRQPGKFDGVSYLPISEWKRYACSTSHDVSIIQRDPMALNQQLQSKLNVLWCHDLGLLRYRSTFRSSLWNVDYVVPVSHWHGKQLAGVYDLPAEIIVPMYNGIDVELIEKSINGSPTRNSKALIYASRPERGMDLLLESVFPRLLERDPALTLYIAGYENTVSEMEAFYQHCHQLIANLGPRAKWLGGLSKPDLYRLYSRGAAYLYPSRNFDEVFCISFAEAAACGLPFVGTTLGALPEVTNRISGSASLVKHPGQATETFISAFVEEAWRVISDQTVNDTMSSAGKSGSKTYSWDTVAAEWEDFLIGAIELRSVDRQRLVRHWWRLGDLNGIAALPEEEQRLLSPEKYAQLQNTEIDSSPLAVPDHVIRAVGQVAGEVKARIVWDLSGNKKAAQHVAQIADASITQSDFSNGQPDFVFGIETLDCSLDPVSHIASAEKAAGPGGHVCLIIASPGVQQDRLHRGSPRKRRWVFDNHDMQELLSNKLDLFSIIIGGGATSEYDKHPLSWILYRWRVSPILTDSTNLDMTRRTRLQSPRPSLSGCLIVKNAENMLHRCLKSIQPYCDEIIVDDNGSTDSTKEILQKYDIIPAAGESPVVVGFDEARNVNIARATGDFILWIDADEELLNGKNLSKYLRWSIYDGFGISQHHFSADPANAFKPDLPVRIFKKRRLEGKPTGIRFWGVVHEHPEIALNHSVGQSIILSDVHIAHEGYLIEDVRRRRFTRNIPLMFRDRIKYPDRVLGKFLMIRDWCHLARYSIEQNQNALTPEAVHYLEAAISQYQKDFLGLTHIMAVEGIQYYNEALRMLSRGFEVQVSLKIGGLDGAPHELNYAGRVASDKDLEILLLGGTKDLTTFCREKYL